MTNDVLGLRAALVGILSAVSWGHAAQPNGPATTNNSLPANLLDQTVLADCDDRAMLHVSYDLSVQNAAQRLTELGVFAEEEFRDVRIGFCPLKDMDGPVATTSCESDIILLDHKYKDEGNVIALVSTLAHEMKHILQLTEKKKDYGDDYCSSAAYDADRVVMEIEADNFGDKAAAMALVGRPIEIENACNTAIRIYVDGEKVSFDGEGPGVISVEPQATLSAHASTTSKFIKIFADAEPNGPHPLRKLVYGGEERIIDGKRERLAPYRLSVRDRVSGPFVLKLECE